MMNLNRESIFQELKAHKQDMVKFGIKKVGLFGSYVRNEQRDESDIDLLIDFNPGKATYDNFMGVYDLFEDLFPTKKVSVATIGGLNKFIAPYILSEVQYV